MTWSSAVNLIGDAETVRIGASDVAQADSCGRYMALKVHPRVSVSGWRPHSLPWADRLPIPVVLAADLIVDAQAASGTGTHAGLQAWLEGEFERRQVHRLLRPFLRSAVDNALEAHDVIEGELRGPSKSTAEGLSWGFVV
jgi:hypothetical protein